MSRLCLNSGAKDIPSRTQRRQNRLQAQESKGTTSRASQGQSRSKRQRRASSRRWFTSPVAQWTGIGAIVVVAIIALVVFGVRTSSASDFEFTMYQGEDVLPVSEFKYSQIFPAEKPVVLNFWAGLCPICRVDMPHFQAVYDQMGDDFIFLALDIGPFVGLGSQQDARNLLQELNISYPAGYVHDRDAMAKFRVTGTPTTVFLTPDGKVFQTWPGFLDQRDMARLIQDMLKTSGAVSS